jgi:acyl dehydratase
MNEYRYDEIKVGQTEQFSKKITTHMEDLFRELSGDVNPLHIDDDFARKGGRYNRHICFGMLSASFLSTLAGVYLPGKYSLIHSVDNISFKNPVYAGDMLTVTGTVREKQDDLKLLIVGVKITNGDGKAVLKANMKIIVQQ